jgi:hypothetical protein
VNFARAPHGEIEGYRLEKFASAPPTANALDYVKPKLLL